MLMELVMLCARILFIINVNGNGNGLFQTIKLDPINLALLLYPDSESIQNV